MSISLLRSSLFAMFALNFWSSMGKGFVFIQPMYRQKQSVFSDSRPFQIGLKNRIVKIGSPWVTPKTKKNNFFAEKTKPNHKIWETFCFIKMSYIFCWVMNVFLICVMIFVRMFQLKYPQILWQPTLQKKLISKKLIDVSPSCKKHWKTYLIL